MSGDVTSSNVLIPPEERYDPRKHVKICAQRIDEVTKKLLPIFRATDGTIYRCQENGARRLTPKKPSKKERRRERRGAAHAAERS